MAKIFRYIINVCLIKCYWSCRECRKSYDNVRDVREAKQSRVLLTALLISVLIMILLNILVGPPLWNTVFIHQFVPGLGKVNMV